jgi:RNA polymerase sigma-70 factor (ECF subfamily)
MSSTTIWKRFQDPASGFVPSGDSVSLALLLVLEHLSPPERLAFVLHDVFDMPFEEVARVLDRTPAAARQLASRARRQVRGAELTPADGQPEQERAVVDAFYAATNTGDMAALVGLLAPDVVFRADTAGGGGTQVYRGRERIARLARAATGADLTPVLVNGMPAVLASRHGEPVSLTAFTIAQGVIVEIDGIRDAERVRRIAATLQ